MNNANSIKFIIYNKTSLLQTKFQVFVKLYEKLICSDVAAK